MTSYTFEQGHIYAGGASRPFFVSLDAVQGGGEDLGFSAVHIYERTDPIGAGVEAAARTLPAYDDDWNTIGFGQWSKSTQALEVPSQVRFIFDVTPPAKGASSPKLPGEPSPTSPTGLLTAEQCGAPWRRFALVLTGMGLLVGGIAGAGLMRWRLRRRTQARA